MRTVSDAARPAKRALHVETLKLLDDDHAMFDLQIPAPAVLRSAIARQFKLEQRVIGSEAKHGIALVLTFEVDPDASPIARRYYALSYGAVIEGPKVGELVFELVATLPNGAPIAIYAMDPPAKQANGTHLSVQTLQALSKSLTEKQHTPECRAQPDGMNCICRGQE